MADRRGREEQVEEQVPALLTCLFSNFQLFPVQLSCVCVYRYLESDYRAESSANVSTWSIRDFPAQGCRDGGTWAGAGCPAPGRPWDHQGRVRFGLENTFSTMQSLRAGGLFL